MISAREFFAYKRIGKLGYLADEIHCDLVMPGFKHVPFASLSEEFAQNSITAHAASKTFNLAGLATSTVIIPNDELRKKYCDFVHATEADMGNVFGKIATKAAMEKGDEWHAQLINYIKGNIDFLDDYLQKHIPQLSFIRPQASYLVFLDCRALGLSQEALVSLFIDKAHLALNDGSMFGVEGEGFMRLNVGCPRAVLAQALKQLADALK